MKSRNSIVLFLLLALSISIPLFSAERSNEKALKDTQSALSALISLDLDEVSLMDVIDDARSLSLFAPDRLIWASSAESALPRGRGKASENPGVAALGDYLANPSPAVVLVLEAARWEFEGEGKKRLERVRRSTSTNRVARSSTEWPGMGWSSPGWRR